MVRRGIFRDRWRVRRKGALIHAEDICLSGDLEALTAKSPVLAGNQAFATLLYCGDRAESLLPKLLECLGERIAAASHWNGKLIIRFVASEGFELRKILFPAISLLRNGEPAPKVWHL